MGDLELEFTQLEREVRVAVYCALGLSFLNFGFIVFLGTIIFKATVR